MTLTPEQTDRLIDATLAHMRPRMRAAGLGYETATKMADAVDAAIRSAVADLDHHADDQVDRSETPIHGGETLRLARLRMALEIGGLSTHQRRILRYAIEAPEARLDEVTLVGWDENHRPVLTKRNAHGGTDRFAVRRNGDPDDPRGAVTTP